MGGSKRTDDPKRAGKALLEDPIEPKIPEQDNEVDPDERTRRDAAAEALTTSRAGVAGAGVLMDGDPQLDRTSETEAALKRATAKNRSLH